MNLTSRHIHLGRNSALSKKVYVPYGFAAAAAAADSLRGVSTASNRLHCFLSGILAMTLSPRNHSFGAKAQTKKEEYLSLFERVPQLAAA